MASINVMEWISRHEENIGDNVFEVGSKKYKEHAYLDIRQYLQLKKPKANLVGCDISAGENVDIILDLTKDQDAILKALGQEKFDTIFCISVLEHVPDVFAMSRNLSSLMAKGGAIFISVPFVFRYHGYPGDLWRFTPEGIMYLFPDIDFLDFKFSNISTLEQGDEMELYGKGMDKMNRFIFRPKSIGERIERKQLKRRHENVPPYSLAPSMINMLGFKK